MRTRLAGDFLGYIRVLGMGAITMEMRPLHPEGHRMPVPSTSTPARLEIISVEISTMTTLSREITDDEMELIEMRYRQALALENIETLFAEGQLDCM
jgi:hypothetical protein